MGADAAMVEVSYLTLENMLDARSKLILEKEKIIICKKGDKFYFFRYENSAKDFERYTAAFMHIARSMKIK
jgi:hypothetical protein